MTIFSSEILKTIENTKRFVQQELADAEGGHDWFHIDRVYKNALLISKEEDVDLTVGRRGEMKDAAGSETATDRIRRFLAAQRHQLIWYKLHIEQA